MICCALVAAVSGYAIWQGERALRSRLADERARVERTRGPGEPALRLAGRTRGPGPGVAGAPRRLRASETVVRGLRPGGVHRVDVAGGTLSGWSAMLATAGAYRLAAGGEVTVLDLTEGSVALDLLGFARTSGIDPLVWVLPADLPRLDLGAGLSQHDLADMLSLVASVSDQERSARDLSLDNAILERVIDALGGQASFASVAAALRALAQVGDPRDDVAAGLITAGQVDNLTAMFGRGATDRVVLERAWILESQLRKLAPRHGAGTAAAQRAARGGAEPAGGRGRGKVFGTYLAVALTHALRETPPGRPWRHTLFVLGADRLRGDTLDQLSDVCESTGTGLVLAYRTIPRTSSSGSAGERRGRLHAARQRRGRQGRERAARHRAPLCAVPAHRDNRPFRNGHHRERVHQHHGFGEFGRHVAVSQRRVFPQHRAWPQRRRQPLLPSRGHVLPQRPGQRFAEHRRKRLGQHRHQLEYRVGGDDVDGDGRQRIARPRHAAFS